MRGHVEVLSDRIRKTLLVAENVKLLRIPPPKGDRPAIHSRDGLYDVSAWDWGQVVWCGRLRFVQEELFDQDDGEGICARVELLNYSIGHVERDTVFGVVPCDVQGESIKQTHSRRAFRVLIEHKGMKIALGLVFDDSSTANEFVSDIKSFKKAVQEAMEAKKELDSDTTSQQNGDGDGDNNDDNDDDDDDDDFGDFVSG